MVSCLVYRDTNTAISALEALHQLLLSTTMELSAWLTTPVDSSQLVTDFWCDTASDSTSDTQSQISEVSSYTFPITVSITTVVWYSRD